MSFRWATCRLSHSLVLFGNKSNQARNEDTPTTADISFYQNHTITVALHYGFKLAERRNVVSLVVKVSPLMVPFPGVNKTYMFLR